jgi:hypothetical protein
MSPLKEALSRRCAVEFRLLNIAAGLRDGGLRISPAAAVATRHQKCGGRWPNKIVRDDFARIFFALW